MVIEDVAKHMPADGKVWITNNTRYHNFLTVESKIEYTSLLVC